MLLPSLKTRETTMPPEPDQQTRAISSGLKQLQSLLESPVAMSALDLDRNVKAAAQYAILKRLGKSLLQYIERDGALFYVGLIGHFSAGKTSSINSLLNTWNTELERKTDFHPTDKTITLITQGRNADSLLGVIREGHVPIRLQKIESTLLNQIVLVDTPGTGDPEFFEEVARDFLPICDVILFLFSAASPLDASDVPLLKELHLRLPFIPLHFVVTRADELRLDPRQALTEANFDTAKASHFLDSGVSRVNALLAPQVYQSTSFTFIDNRNNFRLDQLRSFIENKCDTSNPHAHTAMHMNKLQFYLQSARELNRFFAGILEHKLAEVSKIVASAARNIERYQEIVQISNNNLTKAWLEATGALTKASARSIEALRVPSNLPADFIWFQAVNNKKNELYKDMERDARFAAQAIAASTRSFVTNLLREQAYQVEKAISENAIPKLNSAQQKLSVPPIQVVVKESDIISSAVVIRRYNDLRDAEAMALRDAASDLRRLIKELGDAAHHKQQLHESTSIIENAKTSLKDDLEKFFQNVELYRTGVFSHTTKEAIATLGIGHQLDQLENEFTEQDKERFVIEATSQLFPDADVLLTSMSNMFFEVSEKEAVLAETARLLRLERGQSPSKGINDALSRACGSLASDLTQALQADVALFCSELNLRISEAIVDAKSKYDYQVEHFRTERRRSYVLFCGIMGLIWLAAVVAVHHERPAPKSAAGEAALSIAAGLILQLGTVLFVNWWKSLPKLLNRVQEDVHSKLSRNIREEIAKALQSIRFGALDEAIMSARLNKLYIETFSVENELWRGVAVEFFMAIKDLQQKFMNVRQQQLANIDALRAGTLKFFADPTHNLTILTGIAVKIKERAIEPSFSLLDTTREQLLKVKNQVLSVTFG